MKATVGARVVIHGAHVGQGERHGEILEVRGEDASPPPTSFASTTATSR